MAVLFAVAWYGDRQAERNHHRPVSRPVVYSLTLAVYCTSWTFFGAVGQAASGGWSFLPIYLGPALVLLVFWGLFEKIIRTSKKQNITSIADFIAARYGKTQSLAVLVTLIAVIAALPYIALQLKAVSTGYALLTAPSQAADAVLKAPPAWNDTALYVALLLAAFAILFGTRHLDATEHHEGLMLAIALESVVKLLAFLAVGAFVTWGFFGGFDEVQARIVENAELSQLLTFTPFEGNFIAMTLLSMAAIFCLPRQFHVAVVENSSERDLLTARWLFPIYLALFCVFIVPIAVAGLIAFPGGGVHADTFVLTLPIAAGQDALSVLALLGGFSAATGMVIVATVALSTMVCNDIVMPALLNIRWLKLDQRQDLSGLLLLIRRGTIVAVLILSFIYYRSIGESAALASIGLLSFALVAQFAPAVIGALYWKRGHRNGVLAGLSAGFLVWAYTLLLPNFAHAGEIPARLMENGPWGIAWLRPEALFGLDSLDPLSHCVVWSLLFNISFYMLFSFLARPRLIDRIQAAAFVEVPGEGAAGVPMLRRSSVTVGDLQTLLERFAGPERTRLIFQDYERQQGRRLAPSHSARPDLVRYTERLLASVIGAASARVVLTSALRGTGMQIEHVVAILDETSQVLQFNQELLQTTLENIGQGISVIDKDLRIVAWNQRYLELFGYPKGLIKVGRPISEVIRYNAEHGECGPGNVEEHVQRRLDYMAQGSPHSYIRVRRDGAVIEMRGNPMPGGGFVTSFTDITHYKHTEDALRESERNIRIYTDNLPALIAYVDRDRRFQFANKAYARALKLERDEIIGKRLDEVLNAEQLQRRLPYIDAVLRGERINYEIELPTQDQGLRYLLVTYIPHFGEREEVLGYYALFQDITERRTAEMELQEVNENLEQRVRSRTEALTEVNAALRKENDVRAQVEEALRQAKTEAEQANLSKTRFLAAASHDLLQPLNAARLFTSALEQRVRAGSPDHHDLVERIDGSLGAAEELLGALLDISKLDAGALQPDLTDFPINRLLMALSTDFSALGRERGLEFRMAPCRCALHSDIQLLRRILQNFLSNALRYTRTGRVLLGCRRRGARLRIEVWDTGPGMKEEDLKEIFEEFHRLHEQDEFGEKGLGLGLAIAERIARMLDHPISVRSWPGRGTVFTVDVPLAHAQAIAPAAREPAPRPAGGLHDALVLCIDNESSILDGMAALLSGWSCQVVLTTCAREARAAFERNPGVGIILADYHLNEGIDGIAVTNELRARWGRDIPGIIISADHTARVREQAQENGYLFLQKPLKPAALRAMMNKLLTQYAKAG